MDGSEKGKLFFFCFCLVRLLPGTGLIACSALGEALPLSCQRFLRGKRIKEKRKKIPNWICVKAVTITELMCIEKIKQDFTFGGFCCGILIGTARYRLGWRRVSVSSRKQKTNKNMRMDEATKWVDLTYWS